MKSNLWRRLAALLASAGLAGSLLATVAAPVALAGITSPDCAFADVITPTECQITQPWTVGGGGVAANNYPAALPGPGVAGFSFHKTLHILAGGSLNASAAGAPGITISIDNTSGAAADSLGGTGQLIMDAGASLIDTGDTAASGSGQPGGHITVDASGGGQLALGSTIRAENDTDLGNGGKIALTFGATSFFGGTISSRHTSATGGDAGDIRVIVTGNLTMGITSVITAQKTGDSNEAGDIWITVSGDMTMQAGGAVTPGATITAAHPGATNDTPGGNIRIDVGTGDQGTFTMENFTLVDSGGSAFAGNIWIKAGFKVNINEGAKVLAGQFDQQTSRGHGGRIFVIAGCEANIFGILSSQGHDPGADLVHVEGCLVHVGPHGLVESTAPAHQPVTPASCDNVDDNDLIRGGAPALDANQPGEVFRPGHPDTSSVCVEIWARHVTIDQGGEVNANYAQGGGPEGHGWVDIFSQQDITINGPAVGTAGTPSIPGGVVYLKFAVHSNSHIGNDTGGDVTVKAQGSFVSLTGQALQADATANGGRGGHVIVQAAGNVGLDASIVEAKGAPGGGAPSGGTIEARSFTGTLTGALPGLLDASGDGAGSPGLITLQSCLGTNYTGGSTPAAQILANACPPPDAAPTIPAYVVFDPAGRWSRCGNSTVSGTKWLDKNGNGVRDLPDDVGLNGWTIHLFNASYHDTETTAPDGSYTFSNVPSGTFTVCEQLLVAVPAWSQSFPAAGVDCTTTIDTPVDNPTPGPIGYSVTVDNSLCCTGQVIKDKDFGNFQNATKSGVKWNDVDGDGFRDAGDDPLNGWVIHLFGTSGAGAAVHQTFTTGTGGQPAGAYTFSVPPGTYTVCETLQPLYNQTFPNPGTADCDGPPNPDADNLTPGPNGYAIVLTSGQADTDNDFGNHTTTFHSPDKSGIKFNDLNGNGIKDAGEPGLAGWPINLYGPGPGFAFNATTDTAADGSYHFTIPSAGDWRVCEGPAPASLPGAWVQTMPNVLTPPPNVGETIISSCPVPNVWGYQFNVPADGGPNLVNNDFGNFIPNICQKPTAIGIMNSAFPGNFGPDFTVVTDAGQLIQPVIDAAFDKNGDKYVIIFVIAHADGTLGGSSSQTAVISKNYTATANSNYPFGLIGCSVTLTGGGTGPSVWIKDSAQGKQFTLNGKPTNILVADLHGGNSAVGVQADGTKRYLRNEGASGNATGILVNGNSNTVHNGAANGNTGDGVVINGNSNYVTDTNSMGNGGNGVNVTGNSNQLLKLDVGEKSTPNAGDGVRVSGNSNTLSEIDAFNNGRWGINITLGTGNQLLKNVAGDKGKGNGFAAQPGETLGGYRIAGTGSQLTENKANANIGLGFLITGTGNKLSKNLSNTGNSGGDLENSSFEYKLNAAITNQGGNQADKLPFTATAIGTYGD